MLRITKAGLSLLILLGLTSSVSLAQDSPLAFFTRDVDVVVRLREPDQTFEKLVKVVNKIQPGVGDAVEGQQAAVLGRLTSNPSLTGVDETRDWYLGVYAVKGAPPTIVFAIPATNTADFVAALGDDFTTQVHKNWVFYTDAEELPAVTGTESALTLLDSAAQARLTTGDLTAFVNARHLSAVYAGQLELMKEKVLESLNSLRFLDTGAEVNFDEIARIYTQIAEGFFQMADDADFGALSLSFTETEIGLDKFVQFKADSNSAKRLADSPQSKFESLERLPGNWPIYAAMSGNVGQLMEWGIASSANLLNLKGEQKAAAEEQKAEFAKIDFGAMMMAMDIADTASASLRGVSLLEVAQVDKLRELTRKNQQTLGNLSTAAFEQTTTVQLDAETYGPYKCDIIHVKQTYTEDGDPTGISQKTQNLLLGEEGMETRNCYLDKFYANTVGGGRKPMEDLVAAVVNKKSNRLERFRKSLLPEANFLLLFDLPGTVARGVKVASKVEGSPLMVNPQAVDNLGLRTSYIGAAVGSEGNTLKFQLRVPIEQITGMTKLGVLIGASMRPGL